MLEIICRDMWYALLDHKVNPLKTPAQHVFVMNTHTKPCRRRVYCHGMVRRIQQFNINIQRKPDIRYNFLIGGDASVYEGRGWWASPVLPKYYKSYSDSCILIAYIGTYTASTVPKHMAEASLELVKLGIVDGLIAKDFEYHDITHNSPQPPSINDLV